MMLRWLEAFKEIMTTGTVTKAAFNLNVTQPAVSRMLSKLEAELGVKLFARQNGRLVPTAEGERFFLEAEHVISGISEINRIGRDIRESRGAHLRLIAMPTIAEGLIPKLLPEFLKHNPTTRITLQIRNRRDVETWVASNRYDLGLAVLPVEHRDIGSECFLSANLVAALPPGHPLASKRSVTIVEMGSATLISLPKSTLLGQQLETAFATSGLQFPRQIQTTSLSSTCQMVSQGIGVAIVDPLIAQAFSRDHIVVRPLSENLERSYGFLFPRNRPQSIPARRFMSLTRKYAASFETSKHGPVRL